MENADSSYTSLLLPILIYGAPFWVLPLIALFIAVLRRLLAALARLKTGRRFHMPAFTREFTAVADRWEAFWESSVGIVIMVAVAILSILGLVYY